MKNSDLMKLILKHFEHTKLWRAYVNNDKHIIQYADKYNISLYRHNTEDRYIIVVTDLCNVQNTIGDHILSYVKNKSKLFDKLVDKIIWVGRNIETPKSLAKKHQEWFEMGVDVNDIREDAGFIGGDE